MLKVKKQNTSTGFKLVSIFLLALFSFAFAFAQQKVLDPAALAKSRSGAPTLVNDFANVLTPDQRHALESKLVALDDSTFTQVAVVIVESIGSYNIADYNVELARELGVGNKKTNSGVLLLIAKEDRKLDITVGYGLEGALPDATSKSIIDDIIVPNFKGEDYYRGIDEGTDAIIAAVKGEYNTPRTKGGKGMPGGKLIVIIIIILFILFSGGGGKKGGTFMSRRGARGLPGPIFFPMGGGGGGWGGGSGGGGGGGFGGFGGGSFGGGGSSGSW